MLVEQEDLYGNIGTLPIIEGNLREITEQKLAISWNWMKLTEQFYITSGKTAA
jgi:hypothetical protein